MSSGFAFVSSNVKLEGLPYEVIPGHVLREARDSEVANIRERANQFSEWAGPPGPLVYDHEIVLIEDNNGVQRGAASELPRDHWRHYGLAWEKNNTALRDLERVLALVEPPLYFAFSLLFLEPNQQGPCGYLGYGATAHPPMRVMLDQAPNKDCTAAEIAKTSTYYAQLKALAEPHQFIRSALESWHELQTTPTLSTLSVLGLFSVIESLMTHKPRLQESLDSIGHQLRTKSALLPRRFERAVLLSSYFGDTSSEKVWQKLYAYRSAIAHGERTCVEAELRSSENVQAFLNVVIRECLKLALRDPELVSDLRAC